MEEKLLILDTFLNPIDAEYWCTVLKDAGIQAFVDGAATGTALSHVGTALGGVKLLVSQKEFPIAKQIYVDRKTKDTDLPQWKCSGCSEINEGNFEFCWNCAKEGASN